MHIQKVVTLEWAIKAQGGQSTAHCDHFTPRNDTL